MFIIHTLLSFWPPSLLLFRQLFSPIPSINPVSLSRQNVAKSSQQVFAYNLHYFLTLVRIPSCCIVTEYWVTSLVLRPSGTNSFYCSFVSNGDFRFPEQRPLVNSLCGISPSSRTVQYFINAYRLPI